MPIPISVKGVLLLDERVVLVKNSRDEWELPGGRIEPGEDPTQALAREFLEELSLTVNVGNAIDSYTFEVIPGRFVVISTFGCTLDGSFVPRLSEEHIAHCAWPVSRLSELNLPVGYRRSVETWLRTR